MRCLLAVPAVLLVKLPAVAQPGNYFHIQGYSAIDGFKPYQAVYYITEDNKGLIWIGTDNGLHNFDGKFFKAYTHKSSDTASIPSNLVFYNYQDRHGLYWTSIATRGLYNYSAADGSFRKFSASNENIFDINKYQLSLPFEDSEGNLWFGAFLYGIVKYDRVKNAMIPYKICFPGNCEGFRTSSWISKFYEDPLDKSLWLLSNKGLVHFHPHTGAAEIFYDNTFNNKLTDGSAIFTAVCGDNKNKLWLGTWGQGIKKFDPVTKTFETFLPFPELINGTRNICDGIAVRDSVSFWVSCLDQGFLIFNTVTGKFSHVNQLEQFASYRNCQGLKQVKNGTLWFCSDRKLCKLNPAENLFSFYPFGNPVNGNDESAIAECFIKDKRRLLVGRYYNGALYEYNLQTGKSMPYVLPGGSEKYDVSCLAKDGLGNTWMATTAGTFIADPVTDSIRTIKVVTGDKEVFNCRSRAVSFDKAGNAWVATSRGLVKYNLQTREAVLFSSNNQPVNHLPGNDIYTVFCDSRDNTWIGLISSGLACLKKGDSSFTLFNETRNKKYLQANCTSIAEGADGRLFYTLDNLGLFVLQHQFTPEESIESFGAGNVLPTDYINSVFVDNKKRVWVYSSAGISLFDPIKKSSITFTQKEGLIDCPFSSKPFQDEDGNLYVGGNNGFQIFNPDSILAAHPVTKAIHFSDFRVNGKPYHKEPFNIDDGHAIVLETGENTINFQFAALATSFSNQLRYAHRLKGYEQDWISDEKNNITYSNLPPGEYDFQVKTGYFTSSWNNEFYSIHITIKNPWYRQWWFLLLCLTTVLLLLCGLYRYRINSLKVRLKLKTDYDKKIAEIEMKALRAQMNPHFIFNCLNSINRYIVKSDEKTASSYLTRFSKLIRLILDNSSSETIPVEKEIETLRLYIEMEALRFDHVFDFSVDADPSIIHSQLEIPSMLVQPYVENAIWHGLLHKENGRGVLKINFERKISSVITITISDNGIGREKAAEQKSKDALKRKSYGMQITSDRIQLINNVHGLDATVEINDLKDEQENVTGTEVVIKVPVK